MKRIIWASLIITGLLLTSQAFAAGTCVPSTLEKFGNGYERLTITCTADAADGSFPATEVSMSPGFITRIVTNPGTTAPTDDYDITLTDVDSVDTVAGSLVNRDTTVSEQVFPSNPPQIDGAVTVNITNNAVHSAVTVIKIYSVR